LPVALHRQRDGLGAGDAGVVVPVEGVDEGDVLGGEVAREHVERGRAERAVAAAARGRLRGVVRGLNGDVGGVAGGAEQGEVQLRGGDGDRLGGGGRPRPERGSGGGAGGG